MTLWQLLIGFTFVLALTNGDQSDQLSNSALLDKMASASEDPHCLGNSHIHRFYRQMKCQPEMSADSKCPTSYKCATLLGRSHEKCYYDGKEYPVGHNLTRDTVTFHTPCIQSCQCVRMYEGARFYCTQTPKADCRSAPGCRHYNYLEDFTCCQRGVTSCNQGKPGSVKCVYQGRSYNEGERFFPNDDITCSHCVCASGFNGTIAPPFCTAFACALELWGDTPIMLTRGCAPVYLSQAGCCPITFRCPKPTDRVIGSEKKNFFTKPGRKCYFGNLTMEVGDTLTPWTLRNGQEVGCSCRVPPIVSCVFKKFILTENLRKSFAMDSTNES